MKTQLERFVVNVGGQLVKKDKLEGRDHYVVPAAMMAEGVITGSHGPLFYPSTELANSVPAWNYKPIVVYHPKDDKTGKHVSACQPNILNTRKVGVVLNARYDDKLRAECWFDIERTKAVDARIIKAIEAGRQIEASTGVFVDNDGQSGEWNGLGYDGNAVNHRPDHFAALPDQTGAYSVEAGGGILTVNVAPDQPERVQKILRRSLDELGKQIRACQLAGNQLSFDEIGRQLSDLLAEKYGLPGKYWGGYIVQTYSDPNKVVFCTPTATDGPHRMYEVGYTLKDDEVALSGDPAEVERVVEYRPVGNSGTGEERSMAEKFDKAKHIASLIGNGYEESDKPTLEAMTDDQLRIVKPVKPAATVVTTNTAEKPAGGTPSMDEVVADAVTKTAAAGKAEGEPKPEKKVTWNELVENADPTTKAVLEAGKRAYERQAGAAIKTILANNKAAGFYTKEKLGKMATEGRLEELQSLAALATPEPTDNEGGGPRFDFGAGVDEPTTNRKPEAVEPLVCVGTGAEPSANGAK